MIFTRCPLVREARHDRIERLRVHCVQRLPQGVRKILILSIQENRITEVSFNIELSVGIRWESQWLDIVLSVQ